VDVFDREQAFIDTVLPQITRRFAGLRLVLEHVTTREAVQYVAAAPANVAATITAHHLLLNRNALFTDGIRPHYFCLPLLKRETHRRALVEAATGGNPKFFLGTDSAPHSRRNKETQCGHAGIYTAHAAIELYAEVFEVAGALDKFEAFASFHGADYYHLPRNTEKITLRRESWRVQSSLALGEDELVPLRAGENLAWRLQQEPVAK
jgi:dihydroorotase